MPRKEKSHHEVYIMRSLREAKAVAKKLNQEVKKNGSISHHQYVSACAGQSVEYRFTSFGVFPRPTGFFDRPCFRASWLDGPCVWAEDPLKFHEVKA